MAGSIISVNTSTLKGTVSDISAEIAGLKNDVNMLKITSAVLSGMWDGPAKNAFVSAVNDDIRLLEDLIKAIDKFTERTDTSRAEYDKCENAVAGIIAAIRV